MGGWRRKREGKLMATAQEKKTSVEKDLAKELVAVIVANQKNPIGMVYSEEY